MGAAAYRILFDIFRLNPLPFRIPVYSFLLLNAWLAFRLAKRLSGSGEIGAVAATVHQDSVTLETSLPSPPYRKCLPPCFGPNWTGSNLTKTA
jgi:hypothetical protein